MPKRPATSSYADGKEEGSLQVTTYKWKVEEHLQMAEYLARNFSAYKGVGSKGGKKLDFLRKMRDQLKLNCTDKQLKNGFTAFLNKYSDVRAKLNSSGFGVDPLVDSTLDNGWIIKKCPYFDILDEVFGTRPNVNPPCILASSSIGRIGQLPSSDADSSPEARMVLVEDEEEDFENQTPATGSHNQIQATGAANQIQAADEIPANGIGTANRTQASPTGHKQEKNAEPKTPTSVIKLIKSSFRKVGVKSKEDQQGQQQPKNSIAAFTQYLQEQIVGANVVEQKKLKLDEEKFAHQKLMEEQKLRLEKEKIQQENEIQLKMIEDKREERAHEITKLQLQIELAKLQSKN